MSRHRTTIGNVFAVDLGNDVQKFFQYVADDLTQLNSQVIRSFKTTHPSGAKPDLDELVRGQPEFHAHVAIQWGVKMGLWKKVGNATVAGRVDVLFRNTDDYGNPEIKVSEDWYVWRVNDPFIKVGRLLGKNREAEIGVVISPKQVFERITTGKYSFFYPGY